MKYLKIVGHLDLSNLHESSPGGSGEDWEGGMKEEGVSWLQGEVG